MRETLAEKSRRIALELVPEEQVRAQLERVLASPPFRNSRRCQLLLRYAVEKACEGHIDELKERVVGSAVFGRDASYDTNQDAVVWQRGGRSPQETRPVLPGNRARQ